MTTTDTMTVADILRRAANLIEPEGAWSHPSIPHETYGPSSFCAETAISCIHGCPYDEANIAIVRYLGMEPLTGVPLLQQVFTWNDAHGRTQAEVVATLRAAADQWESEHR